MFDRRIPQFISNQPQFESDGIAAVLQLESGCDMAMLVAVIMAVSVCILPGMCNWEPGPDVTLVIVAELRGGGVSRDSINKAFFSRELL